MIDRVEQRFGLKPAWLTTDTAYGSGDTLDWLVRKKKIVPFVPVLDHSARTNGTWSRSDFTWNEQNDRYLCPEGHELLQYRHLLGPEQGKAQGRAAQVPGAEIRLPSLPFEAPLLPGCRCKVRHP